MDQYCHLALMAPQLVVCNIVVSWIRMPLIVLISYYYINKNQFQASIRVPSIFEVLLVGLLRIVTCYRHFSEDLPIVEKGTKCILLI